MAGQPITLDIPSVGSSGYAPKINTALSTLEVELERPVTPADMDVNADLSFLSGATNSAATDLKLVGLSLQDETAVTAAAFPMSLFAGSSDGELYFNDNFGRQIQITTNGTVNVSTTGGITGSGYGSSGVEVRWDSGDTEFELRSGAGTNDYASARLDDVYLSDGSANFVRVTGQSMSGDYTLTLPAAVPASTSIVLMSSGGTLSTTRDPSIDTLTVGSTSTFTGKATFNAEIAHVQRVRHISPIECYSSTMTYQLASDTPRWVASGNGQALFIPLRMEEGERLEEIVLWVLRATTVFTRGFQVGYWNSNSAATQYLSTTSFTAGAPTRGAVTCNITDIVVSDPAGTSSSQGFLNGYLQLGTADEFYGARVKYSRV